MTNKKVVSGWAIALLLGVGLAATPVLMGPSASVLAAEVGSTDAQLTGAVQNQLRNKNFKNIVVRASDGTVTLSGEVDLYGYKVDAVKKAQRVHGVKDVRDNIAVGGVVVPDNELQEKLLSKIEVDRVGFGQVFSAIGVSVQNGVATLGGHAVGPIAKSSAINLTEYTPGVKGVIDQISVDPVSPMDNTIRRGVYRAIYGYAPMRRYAVNPAKPIRISVQNGRVTLYGTVDSAMDKQLAYTRAMTVPNIFHVTNNLAVAGEGKDQK